MRDTMLVDSADVESRDREGRDCWGVRMGREGSGGAGWARDMHREGLTGRRGWRSSLGFRVPEGVPSDSQGAPRGMACAQARMPASPRPIQVLRTGEGHGETAGQSSRLREESSSSRRYESRSTNDERV